LAQTALPQQRLPPPQVDTATHVPPWHDPRVQAFASSRLAQSPSSQHAAQPLLQHFWPPAHAKLFWQRFAVVQVSVVHGFRSSQSPGCPVQSMQSRVLSQIPEAQRALSGTKTH